MKKKDVNNEDFTFENEEKNTIGFSNNKTDKKLRDKIKILEKEKNEYLDGWQRSRAEMVNIKKTHVEEKKLFTALGKESLIMDIIPTLDNFEAAFSNKEAWGKVDDAWRSGVEYIYSNLKMVLENNGVEQYGYVGEIFDENLHLSIENIKTKEKKDIDKLAEITQSGYKIQGKILREAKVKVFGE